MISIVFLVSTFKSLRVGFLNTGEIRNPPGYGVVGDLDILKFTLTWYPSRVFKID